MTNQNLRASYKTFPPKYQRESWTHRLHSEKKENKKKIRAAEITDVMLHGLMKSFKIPLAAFGAAAL